MEGAIGLDDGFGDPCLGPFCTGLHDLAEGGVESDLETVLAQSAVESVRDVECIEGKDASRVWAVPLDPVVGTHGEDTGNVSLDEEFGGEFRGIHPRDGSNKGPMR